MRTLIVNADDFGIDEPRTRGILEAFQGGIVRRASIIPNMPSSKEATQIARDAEFPLALHLNLSEGKPLSNPQNIETLVNERGEFLGKIPFRKALSKQQFNPHHIIEEVRMQLAWFDENVGVPLHVDGHQHAHILAPIPTFLAPLLRDFGVRSARIPQEPEASWHDPLLTPDQKKLIQEVSMHAGYARMVFTCTGIESTPSFRGMTWMFDCTRARLWNILSSLPEGITELMVHPGYCTERSVPFSSDAQREFELALLTEPVLQEFIQQQDITLSSH